MHFAQSILHRACIPHFSDLPEPCYRLRHTRGLSRTLAPTEQRASATAHRTHRSPGLSWSTLAVIPTPAGEVARRFAGKTPARQSCVAGQ
jgi:hypothetical protein